ncbi:hypothetical protein IIA16_00395, partial [bacterium]|nr:hypothetical protein [bacterium]
RAKEGFDTFVTRTAGKSDYDRHAERAMAAMSPAEEEGAGTPDAAEGSEAPPDQVEQMLATAESLALDGDMQEAAMLVRDALPALEGLGDYGERALGVARAARVLAAAGEHEEALALAAEAWEFRRGRDREAYALGWRTALLVAEVHLESGDPITAEERIEYAMGHWRNIPRDLPPARALPLAQAHRQAAQDLLEAGWYRLAMVVAGDNFDTAQGGLALADVALAIAADPGLGARDKRRLYGHLQRARFDWYANAPDDRWRAGAEEDPLLTAMYAASAVTDLSRRKEAYTIVLEAAMEIGRHEMTVVAVAELDELETVLGPGMWLEHSLAPLALRLPGRHQELALGKLEGTVERVTGLWQKHQAMDGLWEVAEKFAAGGFAARAMELRMETESLALSATNPERDSLLYQVVKRFAAIGEGIRAHSLADAIQMEAWRVRAGTPLALLRAEAGDWEAIWSHLADLPTPPFRMELLEWAAPLLLAAGDTPEARAALARMEEALEAERASVVMDIHAELDLARANLAVGEMVAARRHYWAAYFEFPTSRYYPMTRLDFDMASLATDLGLLGEVEAFYDQAQEMAETMESTYRGRVMMDWRLWREAMGVAYEVGTAGGEKRDEMLVLFTELAAKIGHDEELAAAEREDILAEILDAVG